MKQKTKVEIIEETANFYNLTNRGLNTDGYCVYRTEDGKMCAVGRCLNDDFKPLQNIYYSVKSLFNDNENEDSIFLKEEYVGHSMMFWHSLQGFHDNTENFTTEGLSDKGVERKNLLINQYK
jgi:hypothetical protein